MSGKMAWLHMKISIMLRDMCESMRDDMAEI